MNLMIATRLRGQRPCIHSEPTDETIVLMISFVTRGNAIVIIVDELKQVKAAVVTEKIYKVS